MSLNKPSALKNVCRHIPYNSINSTRLNNKSFRNKISYMVLFVGFSQKSIYVWSEYFI